MIHSFIFSEGRLVARDLEVEALRLVRADKGLMVWIDLDQPTPDEIKLVLEEVFAFHPLAIEDCMTTNSLPKLEDYEDYLFLVTHAVDFTRTEKFNTAELDIFLGKDLLVTFHRTPLQSISAIMDRCAKATGIFARGPDKLLHLVLESLYDLYRPVMAELRTELEEIEESILDDATENLTADLLQVREELNHLRRIVRPQRELILRLTHDGANHVRNVMVPYFRDIRDDLVRIEETAASYNDQLLISFDLYLSKSGFQANESIKALTALTALSLPATLIGGWYGMNFDAMPELHARWGYPIAIAVTVIFTALIYRWVKKRHLI